MTQHPEHVIIVNEVTKLFRMDANYRASLAETLKNKVSTAIGRNGKQKLGDKVALDNISFSITKGSTVGIIGRNGSGKSTLLRMLAGITEPTSGSIEVKGKVTSILDIGSGFIADLTGRENVMMAGSLMGMDDHLIRQRMDEIVLFSEIGDYIDVPVKYYSSGMYLRLAFSLAVHLDMDVLLIDEVIEVGDEAFKIKSYNKLKQLTGQGHTILICTHNMRSVAELCTECLVIEQGKLIAQGDPQQMVEAYIEKIWSNSYELEKGHIPLAYYEDVLGKFPTNEWLQLTHFEFSQEGETEQLYTDKPLELTLRYRKLKPDATINASIWVFDAMHRPILSGNSMPLEPGSNAEGAGEYELRANFPANFFNKGLFFLRLHFVKDNERLIHEHPNQLPFKMHLRHTDPNNLKIDGKVGSPLYMQLPWEKQFRG